MRGENVKEKSTANPYQLAFYMKAYCANHLANNNRDCTTFKIIFFWFRNCVTC